MESFDFIKLMPKIFSISLFGVLSDPDDKEMKLIQHTRSKKLELRTRNNNITQALTHATTHTARRELNHAYYTTVWIPINRYLHKNETFTVRSMYLPLLNKLVPFHRKVIWKIKISLKIKIFL